MDVIMNGQPKRGSRNPKSHVLEYTQQNSFSVFKGLNADGSSRFFLVIEFFLYLRG